MRWYRRDGTVQSEHWYDSMDLHRDHGPARIWCREDGSIEEQSWYTKGLHQRAALLRADGSRRADVTPVNALSHTPAVSCPGMPRLPQQPDRSLKGFVIPILEEARDEGVDAHVLRLPVPSGLWSCRLACPSLTEPPYRTERLELLSGPRRTQVRDAPSS